MGAAVQVWEAGQVWVAGLVLATVLAACTPPEVILTGTRFPVRAPLADSLPTEEVPDPAAPPARAENQSQPISLPPASANATWGQRGGSASHQGPHGALSASPVLVWAAAIGQGNSRQNRIAAAPVVAGGRVFAMDAQSTVTALSTGGALQWQVNLAATFDRDANASGGGLAVEGGRVYATTGYGEVVALEAGSGAVIWRQRLEAAASGAPAIAGGKVFVAARDGSGWALEAATGRIAWQVPGTAAVSSVTGGAAPAVADGAVIFPFASGQVVALTADDGTPLWSASVTGQRLGRGYGALQDITGDPVVAGGVVYAGTAAGRMAALEAATGARLWTATEGAMNPPLLVGGSVFVVNDEARLVRLDAGSGSEIWAVEMPYFVHDEPKKRQAIVAHYGPVLAGGRIAVASSDGALRLFSPVDGAMLAQVAIAGGAASAPALAEGMLFVTGSDGQLYAFR